jgi:hypothetical protein
MSETRLCIIDKAIPDYIPKRPSLMDAPMSGSATFFSLRPVITSLFPMQTTLPVSEQSVRLEDHIVAWRGVAARR